MKKIIFLSLLSLTILSCSKDDEDSAANSECLVCDSVEGLDITQAELSGFCVGLSGEDEETGETITITRADLEIYAGLFNLFGANCKIE
jgi:hypothetical protein